MHLVGFVDECRVELRGVMRSLGRWSWVFLVGFAIAMSCRSAPPVEDKETRAFSPESVEESATVEGPKRIILVIGDGMGIPVLSAASYVAGKPLTMLEMSHFGMMATHEYEFVTTDSAASATAMATGEKTHFNGVSVRPGTDAEEEVDTAHHLRTMIEAAREAQWKTGLVATTRINHATPAPFAANRHHRQQYEELALDMSTSGVDVMLGAGSDFFHEREDGRDLFEEMASSGYTVARNAEEVRTGAEEASRLVGLMHRRDMPWVDTGKREMELDEMVAHALRVLDRDDPEGFFLMVEGSFIDWAGHSMDGERAVRETLDMDRAVARALSYARDRSDTLVVVTSDHETGAMDVIDGATADRYLKAMGGKEAAMDRTLPDAIEEETRERLSEPWAHLELGEPTRFGPAQAEDARLAMSYGYLSAASRADWDGQGRFSAIHTPIFVPLFAEGVGATEVARIRDNADLGRQLMAWIDGKEAKVSQAGEGNSAIGTREMPRNVVVLIGRGLGMSSLTASYYHQGIPAMFEMGQAATVATHSLDSVVNDAAGAATALATGERTQRGAVAMAPGGADQELVEVSSALRRAAQSGKKTGIVTTSSITDVTPAAWYANLPTHNDQEAAAQFLNFHHATASPHGVDFVVSGGGRNFDVEGRAELSEQGYSIHETWEAFDSDEPTLYLLGDDQMESAVQRAANEDLPTLAEITERAIKYLDYGEDGFLLVVDSAQISDAKGDFDRGERLMAELQDFDDAVAKVLQFARSDGETLVVATSDRDHTLSVFDNHYGFHRGRCAAVSDCGGSFEVQWLDVAADEIRHGEGFAERRLQGDYGAPKIGLQYTWMAQYLANRSDITGPASANFVPLFAEGPAASDLGGFMDQTQVGRWLVDWAGPIADEP